MLPVNSLVEVATPEHHACFHVPDQAGVLADHVKVLIKAAVNKDPTALKIRRVEGSSWSVIQTSGDVSLEEPSIPSFTPKVFSSYRIFI